MKIAIRLESLGLPVRRGLREAERLGASGVQLDAAGDLAPANLSQTGRRELRHLLRGHGLELAALGCPLRHGLDTPSNLQPRIEHVRDVMTLSHDLGPRLAIVAAGRIESEPGSPSRQLLAESLAALARHGDRTGAVLALESGSEPPELLDSFLGGFDTGSLAAALDPATMLMNGFDSCEAARRLGRWLRIVQARDARKLGPNRAAAEVPLGHGDVDWFQFTGALAEVDYRGWLVVCRESGERRLADVSEGVAFLRRFAGFPGG